MTEIGLKKIAVLIIVVLIAASLLYATAPMADSGFHGVGVLKSADPFAEVGDSVAYQIKIYNPSDFDLHNINVTDDLLDFNVTIPFMAKGNETGVIYTLNRTVLDTDPSALINTVNVEALDSENMHLTASAQAQTTIVQRLIDLTKTGPDYAHEGDAVKYTITATNLANATLHDVTVEDQLLGFSWKGDLSVEETNMFNITFVVPLDAPDPLINTVTAHAKLNETVIYAEATWIIDMLHPKIHVEKEAYPTEIGPWQNVTYTITTTNTGDSELFNITLIDSIFGSPPASIMPSSLMHEESFTWTFNATISDCTINVVKVTAIDALGKKVYDQDEAKVKVNRICPRSKGYWKNHPDQWPVTEITVGNVTYTKQEAITILCEADAEDATRMLAAQLIAAKLNRLAGTSACFWRCDKLINIDDVIADADSFLIEHPLGSDPRCEDRETALRIKDILDAYNNTCD